MQVIDAENLKIRIFNFRSSDLPAKNIRIENTPRKLPFKDATNQAFAFKTPAKGLKSDFGRSKEIQLPALVIESEQLNADFQPSIQVQCFCDGGEKKKCKKKYKCKLNK